MARPIDTIPAQRGRFDPTAKRTVEEAGTKDPNEDQQNDGMGSLNGPEADEKGQPTQRAITSAKQAWTIAKRLRERAAQGRIKKAAGIASKYNGDAPFQKAELDATGQGWRHNFSTNFLASLIDRVVPQLTDPVNTADILTNSSLPLTYPDGAGKSRKFQERTTKCIRDWKKWKDLLSGLGKEIILYGNAAPMRIDKNWRPRLWGFGECYLPEGCGQHANDVQIAVAFQTMLLHEFFALIKDKKLAKQANYNLAGCQEIANRTVGSNDFGGKDPTPLDYEDRIREGGAMGWSYDNPQRTINLMHVLVHDYSGEVDLWTVDADQGVEVRHEIGLHECIEDGISLFTFQSGNRKFYGSKGLGRLESNLHTAIERGRNLGADQMYLSGLLVFEGDPKDTTQVQTRVRHPFIIIKAGLKLVTQQIAFNSEAFFAMDEKLVELAEAIAGAFIPPSLDNEGSSKTKIEAAAKEARDQAVKEGVLGRFFDHMSELISMMQRGIYCADNMREALRIWEYKQEQMQKNAVRVIMSKVYAVLKKAGAPLKWLLPSPAPAGADEDAVNCIVDLLDMGLTAEEIVTLSLQPSAANDTNEGEAKDNATVQVLTENREAPSPFINQKKAEEMRLRLTIGEDRAQQLLLDDDDPTIKAVAERWQIIEISEMVDGNPMPVPLTDNHAIHRQVLGPRLGDIVNSLATAPTIPMVKSAQLMISHYEDHLNADQITGKAAKAQEEGVMKQWTKILDKAIAGLEKRAQEIAAAGGKMGPDGNPLPVQGQPLAVGPNGQMIGNGGGGAPGMTPSDDPTTITPDHQIKAAATIAEIEARKTDQAIEMQKLQLQQQELDHKVTADAMTLQQKNLGILAEARQHGDDMDQQNADREAELAQAQAAIEAKRVAPGE